MTACQQLLIPILLFYKQIQYHIEYMYIESQLVASSAIELIQQQVWNQIAIKNIVQMMPKNVQKMNIYTFQSLAQLHSNILQHQDRFNPIQQKNCIQRDNLLNSYISVQKTKKSQIANLPNISIVSDMKSKLKKLQSIKKNTGNLQSNKSSIKQSKLVSQRNKEQKNNKFVGIEDQSLLKVQKDQDTYRNIQFLRDRLIINEQARRKEQKQIQISQIKDKERRQILLKKQKQIDKFTYDYDGEFFGSKISNPENTLGAAARIKSEFIKQTPKNMKKTQKMRQIFTTAIANQKLEQRYKRMETQKTQFENNKEMYKQSIINMLANSFSNDDNVSQGISIKQVNSNFFRVKPLTRIGQKLTLSQYKNQITDRKFKQFKYKPVKKSQVGNLYINKFNSHKSQQNFLDNKRNHTTVEVELSQKIKPVKNNIRFKTICRSEQSSILSNSKFSRDSAVDRKRGTIKISNQSLYKYVFDSQSQLV